MEIKTITEEFIKRIEAQLKYHGKLFEKQGEPFDAQALSTMIGSALPAVNLWHGLWYQGEMACLFGEPNVGKTILAMQIANVLSKRGLKTLYFDFENAAHQFKPRYKTNKFDYNSGDASFIVKPLNPNYSTAPLDSRSILEYIKKEFVQEKAPVIIIDDITHLIGSGDQADVRFVLNTLRSWSQHFLISILVLAHSKCRKMQQLTTIDNLAGSFEYSYAFDSIFSLTRVNQYNVENNNVTHYIKHHKNRMGPVIYNELNVITTLFGRDENNGFLQFNELYSGGNERQLLRDNGYRTSGQINQAILKYKELFFSTREIAAIVGCSQSHVSRTIRKHEIGKDKKQDTLLVTNSGQVSNKPHQDSIDNYSWMPKGMPRIKLEIDLTPIYDESQYTIDEYGERMTVEEYNQIYNCEEEYDDYGDEYDEDYDDEENDEQYENAFVQYHNSSSKASNDEASIQGFCVSCESTESSESSEPNESVDQPSQLKTNI